MVDIVATSLHSNKRASLTSLPIELIELIVSGLPTYTPPVQCNPLNDPIRLKTPEFCGRKQAVLRSLSQSCQYLRRVAFSLWRDPEFICVEEAILSQISEGDQLQDDSEGWKKKYPNGDSTTSLAFFDWEKKLAVATAGYLHTICAPNPVYGDNVRTLALIFTPYACTSVFKLLVNALSVLPNLHTLQIHISFPRGGFGYEPLWRVCGSAFHRLFTDTLGKVTFPQIRTLTIVPELWELVMRCPNLIHLHILRFDGMEDTRKIGTQKLGQYPDIPHPSIKKLTGFVPEEMLQAAALSPSGTFMLDSLELHFSYGSWSTLDLSHLSMLRRKKTLRTVKIFPGAGRFPLLLRNFKPCAITSRQLSRIEDGSLGFEELYELSVQIAYSVLSRQLCPRSPSRPTKLIWVKLDGTQVVLCQNRCLEIRGDIDEDSSESEDSDGETDSDRRDSEEEEKDLDDEEQGSDDDEEDAGESEEVVNEVNEGAEKGGPSLSVNRNIPGSDSDQPVLMIFESNIYAML